MQRDYISVIFLLNVGVKSGQILVKIQKKCLGSGGENNGNLAIWESGNLAPLCKISESGNLAILQSPTDLCKMCHLEK